MVPGRTLLMSEKLTRKGLLMVADKVRKCPLPTSSRDIFDFDKLAELSICHLPSSKR